MATTPEPHRLDTKADVVNRVRELPEHETHDWQAATEGPWVATDRLQWKRDKMP